MRNLSTRLGRRQRPMPRDRVGMALRQLYWPVLVIWVVGIVLFHPLAGTLYKVTDDSAAANLPASAASTRVVAIEDAAAQASGRQRQRAVVAVVAARNGGLSAGDLARADRARAAVGRLTGRIDGLAAPSTWRRATDRQAEVFTATVTSPALDETNAATTAVQAVRRAVEQAAGGDDGLQLAVTGKAAITADGGSTSQSTLLLTALVIVALVLLIVYRSVLLWIFPLLGALAGIVVAQAAAHGLATAGLTVSSLSSSILIVLAFGAASDYALLLIHRYRGELRHHAAVEDAMAVALRRTLPTLGASAATVVGAMLCLFAASAASLRGLGPVGAVAIAAALLAQTTFLPAMLVALGRTAFWPSRPGPRQRGGTGSRVWSSVGSLVARRPARVALGAVVVLGAAGGGLLTLHTDNNPLDNLKGRPDSVAGADLFARHFGAGALAPLVLLTPPAEAHSAVATARRMTDVAEVLPGTPVPGYADYSVTLSVDPYTSAAFATVADLRRQLEQDAPGSLVGGDPAVQYDITRASRRDAAVLIPLVLVVIFVVVAALLQALIAPLVLVLTTALSFGASLGLANLLWRYGFGYAGVEAQLPIYVFVFLVALGVDYNIFLAASIREHAHRTGTRTATLRGLAMTGGVITAAGIVLAGTFAALARQPVVDVTEVGTAIALGVMLDTLLVRTVLVPASFVVLGDRVWWPARRNRRAREPAAACGG